MNKFSGKDKNNCHYRDCEAITDNLSRIKNKKGVMPILPVGKIGIFKLNNKEVSSFLCLRGASGNQGIFAPARVLEKHSSCRFLIFLRIGRSLEKIFKKIFRDDTIYFKVAEILGSCFASPRMTFSTLTLAAVLSISIISDSRADAGCLKEGGRWNCYDEDGNQTSSARIEHTDNGVMEITDVSTKKVTWIDSSGQPYSGTFSCWNGTYTIDGGIRTSKTDYTGNQTWYYDNNGKTTSHTEGGETTYYYYDDNDKMTSSVKTNSDGTVTTRTYNYYNGYYTGMTLSDSDQNGNVKTTNYNANGGYTGTTYTDSNGASLTGTYVSGNTTYNISDGTVTDYYVTATDQNGNVKTTNYNANGGYTGTTYTDSNGNPMTGFWNNGYYISDGEYLGHVKATDENGNMLLDTGKVIDPEGNINTAYTGKIGNDFYVDGEYLGHVKATDENGNMLLDTGKVIDSEGNPYEGVFVDNSMTNSGVKTFDSDGRMISNIFTGNTCTSDSSTGLRYCVGYDRENSDKCAVIIKKGSKVIGKTSCTSGYCHSGGEKGATASDCSTELYSPDGKVIAKYDTADIAQNAYDYDKAGNKIVYDDQCRFVEKLDADGNSIYSAGDGLSSENRRTHYTPAEAAEIVGNSDDNMLVMYFK